MAREGLAARGLGVVVGCFLLVDVSHGMLQKGTLRLGGPNSADQWTYITKFGYTAAVGDGTYSLRLRLAEHNEPSQSWQLPSHVNLDVFLDEDWYRVERLAPCDRARDGPARRTLSIDVNQNRGMWGARNAGLLYQIKRPHIWYFALSDCSNSLENRTFTFDYEFHAQQFDKSELGFEARHMPAVESFALVAFTLFIILGGLRCVSFCRRVGELHPVLWALSCAVALQYVSQSLHLLHLFRYEADGEGLWTFDVLAEVLFILSQVMHATLLIAIAQGYTLYSEKTSDLDYSRLGLVAMFAGHAALVCFDKLGEGTSSYKHHDNDGIVGWTFALVRLLLFYMFQVAVQKTIDRQSLRLHGFLIRFRLLGSLYFLAYPLVFLVAQVLAPYLRHPFMQLALLVVQAFVDVWLALLFLTRGTYFDASYLSASLLPGCTTGGCPRKRD